jgi:hypothetical protein
MNSVTCSGIARRLVLPTQQPTSIDISGVNGGQSGCNSSAAGEGHQTLRTVFSGVEKLMVVPVIEGGTPKSRSFKKDRL